jgi:DNA primase catalytic core
MNTAAEKEKINILDVIQTSGVLMEKHGVNWFGLCPFHSEKTPSFSVNEQKQMFYCFGCGAGGDAIEYVQRFYDLDFIKATEQLGFSGDEKITNKARYKAKRYKHHQKRKERSAKLEKQVKDFCDWFYRDCWETVELVDRCLAKLSTEQFFELEDLVKWLQTRRLWMAILDDAFDMDDMETLYHVWEMNQ